MNTREGAAALPDLWLQTAGVGKALISLGHSWAPAQLVRAASPLQHHAHRVKVCPFSALHSTPLTSSMDPPQDSINRLNTAQKNLYTHTHPLKKVKISIQSSKALLESVKMINNSQKENTTPCLFNYFGRTIALKDRIH